MNVLEFLKPALKAVTAFIAPGVVALVAAVQDGSAGGTDITWPQEWVGIIAACILTAAAVWAVPNLPRTNEPRGPDSVSAPEPQPK